MTYAVEQTNPIEKYCCVMRNFKCCSYRKRGKKKILHYIVKGLGVTK